MMRGFRGILSLNILGKNLGGIIFRRYIYEK
jgi:hypothetical protein